MPSKRMERYYANRDYERAKQKEYYKKNKQKLCDKNKVYYRTDEGKKSSMINNWKNDQNMKLKDNEDWDSVYVYYYILDRCEVCNNEFKSSKDKQLDHDHTTGYIRDIVCHSCNQKRRFSDLRNNLNGGTIPSKD